jgi:hypothetical protein
MSTLLYLIFRGATKTNTSKLQLLVKITIHKLKSMVCATFSMVMHDSKPSKYHCRSNHDSSLSRQKARRNVRRRSSTTVESRERYQPQYLQACLRAGGQVSLAFLLYILDEVLERRRHVRLVIGPIYRIDIMRGGWVSMTNGQEYHDDQHLWQSL